MAPSAGDIVQDIAASVASGHPLLLLSDFDGTLSFTADHPDLARMPARSRSALLRLDGHGRCHVGIVSGRSLVDLARIVGMPARFLAGSGGLELLCEGRRLLPPGWREAMVFMQSVVEEVRGEVAEIAGVWVESKACAMTIHHRQASPDDVPVLHEIARAVAGRHGGRCRVIEGALGVEMTAFPERDKGSAVRFFRRRTGGSRVRICYCGNDGNDAPAMATTNASGGWSVGVGPAAPRESLSVLPDPDAFSDFLVALADAVDRR